MWNIKKSFIIVLFHLFVLFFFKKYINNSKNLASNLISATQMQSFTVNTVTPKYPKLLLIQ